ncbi:MAG: hypothetical protein KDB11_14780 [Planctomycetales bacterium]|nr:hypothetical protein [Planctomycetales bacterium]
MSISGDTNAAVVTISPDAADSDDQDISGIVTPVIDVTGIEVIRYTGNGTAAERLDVNLGGGDNTARVERGVGVDLVTSDSLPSVEFTGVNRFRAIGGAGSDVVTFKTWFLTGAVAGNYEFDGGASDALVIEGADGATAAGNDAFLVTNPAGGSVAVTDSRGAGVTVTATNAALGRLGINTLGGDDLVTVDETGGLIAPLITFDGGSGSDALAVTGTTLVTNASYTPGASVTEGRLRYDTMTIDFVNLEPVYDNVLATNLTVNGTNASNAINYTAGPKAAAVFAAATATGLVSIDGFETIEFANKGTLILDGMAGDDDFHLRNGATPDGLTGITVRGNDPTASDSLTVNGLIMGAIAVNHTSVTTGTIAGAEPVTVTYNTLEQLNVWAGISTSLAVTGSTTGYIVNPGAEADQGAVLSSGVPIAFDGYGTGESINLSGDGATTVVVNGTSNNDTFTVAANNNVTIAGRADIANAVGSTVTMNAGNGADSFVVDGGNTLANINVNGGDGDDDDSLDANTPAGAVTVNLGASTVAGYGGLITYTGLQTIDADAGDAQISVVGGATDEDVTVTVFDSESGKVERGFAVQQNGQTQSDIVDPVLFYRNTNGAAVSFDLAGGEDTLIVVGNTLPQRFDVNASDAVNADGDALRTVAIDDNDDASNDGLVTWVAGGIESLVVNGLEGDDTFDVTADDDTTVFIDGGDPIGQTAGDLINIIAGGAVVSWEAGPEPDEGGFIVGANERISYDHIEALGVFSAAKAIIVGTNDDDEITVIARDDSTHGVLATMSPGIQDFTTAVNDSPDILWVNTPEIFIDGLHGDDDITLRTPAPNQAVWGVDVFVAGGLASTPEVGDRLRVETPYQNNEVVYQPTAPDAGILRIYDDGAANLHSTVRIGSWRVDHDGTNGFQTPFEYVSSPGGIESLLYDGLSAEGLFDHDNDAHTTTQNTPTAFTDTVTVVGDGFAQAASNDRFVHTPGNAADSGSVAVSDLTNGQSMLGISYSNIGLGGLVAIDGRGGSDTLVASGTSASDTIDVDFNANNEADITLTSSAGPHVLLTTNIDFPADLAGNVENYEIRAGEGDDNINLQSQILSTGTFGVFGDGNGDGSDSLNITGDNGIVETITVQPDATESDDQDILGLMPQAATDRLDVTGIELIAFEGGNSSDTLNVNLGSGDNTARVARGNNADLVTSNSLPNVEFQGMSAFNIVGQGGADVVTFATWFLGGAVAANYTADLGATDTLVIEGVGGAGVANDRFVVTRPTATAARVTDNKGTTGGTPVVVTATNAATGRLVVNTLGGDDWLTVDVGASDLINVPITFDGGQGNDLLIARGTPATPVVTATYTPGAAVTEGRLTYDANMVIDFLNLEPVVDLIPAATLVVNGTNADNAINYIVGPNSGVANAINPAALTTGLVSVDGFETIEFGNKVNLTLNGNAGDDVISLRNGTTPAGLTGIAVNGNDPTASDKLVVNDLAAGNTVTIATATNTITGAEPVPVVYGTIEGISLTTTIPGAEVAVTGSINYTVNPGAETDEGTILTDADPVVSYFGYGAGETIDLTGAGGGVATVNGTDENDTFGISAGAAGADNDVAFAGRATIETTTLPTVTVNAFEGEDLFNVNGSNIYTTINVNGGDGDDDDILTATNAQSAVEVDLGNSTVIGYSSAAGTPVLNYTGLEIVATDATGQTMEIVGTFADDQIVVTPLDGMSGAAQANDRDPIVLYSGTTTVDIDGGGGEDHLTVNGSSLGEAITVSGTATTTPGGTVTYNSGAPDEAIEALTVNGLQGEDTFTVTPAIIPIFIDGGDPIGSTNTGDTINIQAGNANTTFFPGPEGDEGGIDVGANQTVSYDHIENLTITDPDQLSICGTNADDDITLVTNGPDDLQFSVNDSPFATVTNANSVVVEGKAGDDDIVMQASATFAIPVTLDGDFVTPFVGGTPSSNGDTIKISTPYAGESAEYRPTSSSGGSLTLTTAGSMITLAHAEEFLFDGEENGTGAFATALTVFGNGANNLIVHQPAIQDNAGTVSVDELLPVTYEGLDRAGATGLTIDGEAGNADIVVALGTPAADTFIVPGTPDIFLNTRIPINTVQVESYVLEGLDGDDDFNIIPIIDASVDNGTGTIPILVNAEGPSGSDQVNFQVNIADAGPNEVSVDLDSARTTSPEAIPTITQTGLGAVTLSGVETATIDANENDLYVSGTRTEDTITFTPLSADSGHVSAVGVPTQFLFDEVTQGVSTFTISGGAAGLGGGGGFADKVIVNGTSGRDLIRVDGPRRTVSVEVLPFFAGVGTLWRNVTLDNGTATIGSAGIIESVTVEGNDGDDTFWVASAPAVGNGLYINVEGGEPRASDALVVTNLNADGTRAFLSDAADYVVIHRSRTPDAGNVLPFNATVRRPSISYNNVEVVSANFDTTNAKNNRNTGDPNITIMGPDLHEPNEFRTNSSYVGSGETLQITNAEIFPNVDEHPAVPEDHDYYRVIAKDNGTLDFQVYFNDMNNLVPGDGNINIEVLDAAGNVIGGTGAFGSNENGIGDHNERVRIPAVAGQTYYLHVFGSTTNVINGYDVTVTNEVPAVPYDIELDDLPADNGYNCTLNPPSGLNSDTGRSHFDNITCDAQPSIIFRLDDAVFLRDIQGNDGTVFTNNPPDQLIPIPFNGSNANNNTTPGYRVAIFLEGDPQQPTNEPQVPIGYAEQGAEPGVYTFDFGNANNGAGLTLTNGSHFINAKVQIIDPTVGPGTQYGYGARSQSLEIIVDTVAPPVFFGLQSQALDGLHPDSDTGNPIMESTFSDRITSDRTPTFWGLAEANVNVRLFVDMNGNGTIQPGTDIFIGETVSTPFDGSNQFGNATGNHPNGQWEITSVVNLNDPSLGFAKDGLRRILVDSEDVAGNFGGPQVLEIFLDTQGPRVFDPVGPEPAVFITGHPDYDVFDPKPSINGPTPLAPSITVNIEDLPIRVPGAPASFLYPALKTPVTTVNPATGLRIGAGESPLEPEYFEVRGDYNGIIPIQSVIFRSDQVNSGSVATGEIIFTFFEPLPDDRYTLIIRDALTDHSGNALDGEMDTIEPENSTTLQFPSGDLIPGNDFNARFTIDSRPEIGVWASGNAWIDINGNEAIDPRNADFVNRDIIYTFGNGNAGTDRAFTSDDFFAGNFRAPGPDGFLGTADDGVADGFDKLAVYGSVGTGASGPWRFLVDGNNDGVPDIIDTNGNAASDVQSGAGINFNGLPVAGNFAPTSGDEVGIFTGTTWYFDINGDFQLDAGSAIVTAMRGYPIVGDFDGDGLDDLATWSDDVFQFDLSGAGAATGPLPGNPRINGQVDATINFGFIGVRERPLAADLDQDGIDDIGLWSPDQSGITPNEGAEWFFLVSNDPNGINRAAGTVNTLDHPFKPVPFGEDLYMQLGTAYSIPIVGNFDPPATAGVVDLTEDEVTDILHRLDVNQDGNVSAIDALIIINNLNENGTQSTFTGIERLMDVDGDGAIAPKDVLTIINYLNANNFIQAEGEGSSPATIVAGTGPESDLQVDSSGTIEVAEGQFLAVADTMRIVFAPIAPASQQLEELFALLDDADASNDSDELEIDSLLAAFESDDLFDFGSPADTIVGSALDELLNDDELFNFDELAADVMSSFGREDDLA